METMIVENAKVMAKGQITLPKDIRERIGVGIGDRVTLISEGDKIILVNSVVYAMKVLQKEMVGEAERVGLSSDEDVIEMLMAMRAENRK